MAERAADIPPGVKQLVQDSKSEWLRRLTELENARNRAEARRLAAAAELALASRQASLQVPIAVAVGALRMASVFEADVATRHAIRTAARQICRLGEGGEVHAVAFSPDGAKVATGSGDGSARVFDAATGEEISRLDHGGEVYAVAFSPDGTKVATGSGDQSARVWWVDQSQLIDQAVGRLIRNLTHEEWRRYFRGEPYRKTRADLP